MSFQYYYFYTKQNVVVVHTTHKKQQSWLAELWCTANHGLHYILRYDNNVPVQVAKSGNMYIPPGIPGKSGKLCQEQDSWLLCFKFNKKYLVPWLWLIWVVKRAVQQWPLINSVHDCQSASSSMHSLNNTLLNTRKSVKMK